MLEGLQVHHAPLRRLGRLNSGHFEGVGVLFEQFVGHVGHRALGLDGFLRVMGPQGQDHLTLPEGNRVDDGGLNLLGHHGVVVLEHPNLRAHLKRNHPGQLQVMELLLKAQAEVAVVVGRLGVLRLAARLGLALHLGQGDAALVGQLFLSGEDIHGQLLVVFQIFLVHLVHDGDIFHQGNLVLFQLGGDFVHVDLGLFVLGLEDFNGPARLAEHTEESLFLLLCVEALELHQQGTDHVAHLTHVLGANRAEGRVGKVGDVLLGSHAVLQNLLGVVEVDFLRELVHRLLLRLAQGGQVGAGLGTGFRQIGDGGHLRHGGGLDDRVQGQLGNIFIHGVSLLISIIPAGRSDHCFAGAVP